MLGLGDIVSIYHHLIVSLSSLERSVILTSLIKILQTEVLLDWIQLPRSTKRRLFLKS